MIRKGLSSTIRDTLSSSNARLQVKGTLRPTDAGADQFSVVGRPDTAENAMDVNSTLSRQSQIKAKKIDEASYTHQPRNEDEATQHLHAGIIRGHNAPISKVHDKHLNMIVKRGHTGWDEPVNGKIMDAVHAEVKRRASFKKEETVVEEAPPAKDSSPAAKAQTPVPPLKAKKKPGEPQDNDKDDENVTDDDPVKLGGKTPVDLEPTTKDVIDKGPTDQSAPKPPKKLKEGYWSAWKKKILDEAKTMTADKPKKKDKGTILVVRKGSQEVKRVKASEWPNLKTTHSMAESWPSRDEPNPNNPDQDYEKKKASMVSAREKRIAKQLKRKPEYKVADDNVGRFDEDRTKAPFNPPSRLDLMGKVKSRGPMSPAEKAELKKSALAAIDNNEKKGLIGKDQAAKQRQVANEEVEYLLESKVIDSYTPNRPDKSFKGDRYELHDHGSWHSIRKTHQGGKSLQNSSGGYNSVNLGHPKYVAQKWHKLKKHYDSPNVRQLHHALNNEEKINEVHKSRLTIMQKLKSHVDASNNWTDAAYKNWNRKQALHLAKRHGQAVDAAYNALKKKDGVKEETINELGTVTLARYAAARDSELGSSYNNDWRHTTLRKWGIEGKGKTPDKRTEHKIKSVNRAMTILKGRARGAPHD
jgi:hypothetical protein